MATYIYYHLSRLLLRCCLQTRNLSFKERTFCISIICYTSHWDNQLCLYIRTRLGAEQMITSIRSMNFHSFKADLLENKCCMWISRKIMLRLILYKLGIQDFFIVKETMAGEIVPLRRQTVFSADRELTWGCSRQHTVSSCPYCCISRHTYATIYTHYIQCKIQNI